MKLSTSTAPLADTLRQDRIEVVEDTAATLRLEGLEPTPELQQAFERYVAGEIPVEQIYVAAHQNAQAE